MKKDEILLSYLREWQTMLGLEDWTIRADIVSGEEMETEECVGEAEWVTVNKSAKIRILREEEYGDRIQKYDMEKTLVHELLHLKFAIIDIDNNITKEVLLHQTIEDLAKALVIAKNNYPINHFDNIHYER